MDISNQRHLQHIKQALLLIVKKNGTIALHAKEVEDANIVMELARMSVQKMVDVVFAEVQVNVQDVMVKVVGKYSILKASC